VPTEPKVVRRQILRNLGGNADVFYVDIDTTDLTSTTLTATRSDEDLAAQEAVPLMSDQELPLANRFGVPPSHKSVLASHLGRIFAAGDVSYPEGCVTPVFQRNYLQGIGTNWLANFAGRMIYVDGATKPYEIASVDVLNQRAYLTAVYSDATIPFASYTIRPAPAERKLVYYSEPTFAEAWPEWNAFSVPEDADDITGLMTMGSFLYAIERRHIYRVTMQRDPASDGFLFLSIQRGCLNNRCWVQVENTVYMLDEVGVHAFDGGQETEAISQPIQVLFQQDGLNPGIQVDWTADTTLWHAAHDPVRDTVRWFVQMVGYEGIFHAICYNYRLKRWWVEEYPTAITASATGTLGYRRSLVGTDARRILCLGEGASDYVDEGTATGGAVTSATATSLTDSSARFPANLAGAPVSIVSGTGRGQQRIVGDNTAITLDVVEPWHVIPDATSTYRIGGVHWSWQSGWFEYIDGHIDESENPRDVSVVYQPTKQPTTLDMQLYFDHSDEPRVWAVDRDDDGVKVADGSPFIAVNLQTRSSRAGYSIQRMAGHAGVYTLNDHFVSVSLSGVQGGEPVRVFSVTINGAMSGDR
jgi:hypothetical protein